MDPIAYTLSILGMVVLPVILAIVFRQRYRVYWIIFIVGCLTFLGAQAVHLPLNNLFVDLGILPEDIQSGGVPLWQSALILGLTAGLCEEIARAIGYAVIKWARSFENGVMFGLGHGGIEAMIFGGVATAATVSSLLNLQGVDLETLDLTAAQLAVITAQLERFGSSPIYAFVPFIDRAFALGVQVILSLIVMLAFTRKKPVYILAAVALHMLVDAVAVFAGISTNQFWATWVVFLIFLIPGLIWLVKIWRERDLKLVFPSGETLFPRLTSKDFGLFISSLRKELLYLWRTRRLLVVCAVFLAFSIMSPLLVKFTPQMLSTIEGAEMFADLIPEMTITDAIAQHIETITQFGFIIVILVGMGVVVSEKERGTAAMILSKPLSRAAFLNSKFVAQILMYLLAFSLVVGGGYYYTTILFGNLYFWSYLNMNLLLLLWILVFVAVTLLGSSIGNSTGAAAGISLGGAVLLLLAGSVPQFGALLPGGLLAWAGQITTQSSTATNWGAVTMSVVIILLCLISALGVFERQELQ